MNVNDTLHIQPHGTDSMTLGGNDWFATWSKLTNAAKFDYDSLDAFAC